MTVLRPEAFAKAERLTVPAATKLTPSERREAQEVVEDLQRQGLDVTLSSLYRTAIITWVRAYTADKEASD